VGRLFPISTWECFWKTGAFRKSRVAHGGGGVLGRCLPYDVSIESFEETDTARRRGVSQAWAPGGDTEWVDDAGRVVVIRDTTGCPRQKCATGRPYQVGA
jgi:hypothetical protein